MRYAVAYFSHFDNELDIALVEASDLREAIAKHPRLAETDSQEWLKEMVNDDLDLDEIKQQFFDADQAIDVIAIP